jgi:nitrate/TMAO reductase-like tetraheme cytochrome c subunit
MVAFNKVLALAVIAGAAITFAACDRTITVQEQVVGPQSCFDCHNDQNTFLVAAEAQWQNSVHASGLRINEGSSAGCAGCHISEGFIQRANGEVVRRR